MKTKDFETIRTGFVPHIPEKENKEKEKERAETQCPTAIGDSATKESAEIRNKKGPDPT